MLYNGSEFVNDDDKASRDSAFEKAAMQLGMMIYRIRPYSLWQNGKVERSLREDGKVLCGRRAFASEKELRKQAEKHEKRYNKTAKTYLNFNIPDQVVAEFFSKCNTCLDY